MGCEGAFLGVMLRKCRDGMMHHQTEQRFEAKTARSEGRGNVGRRATHSAALADAALCVGGHGTGQAPKQRFTLGFDVKVFQPKTEANIFLYTSTFLSKDKG